MAVYVAVCQTNFSDTWDDCRSDIFKVKLVLSLSGMKKAEPEFIRSEIEILVIVVAVMLLVCVSLLIMIAILAK